MYMYIPIKLQLGTLVKISGCKRYIVMDIV